MKSREDPWWQPPSAPPSPPSPQTIKCGGFFINKCLRERISFCDKHLNKRHGVMPGKHWKAFSVPSLFPISSTPLAYQPWCLKPPPQSSP